MATQLQNKPRVAEVTNNKGTTLKISKMAETSPLVKMLRSHGSAAFEEKCFAVDGPVIIGRAGALAQPKKDNGIFASFQMSNIHARVFYDHVNCKFFVLDTKSTNGTYIQFKSDPTKKVRLHEDNPVELSSGDILHFGLPGVSNVTKEYNPPIITILKLQHPLKVGKKDMKEYDDYGNELSPSLLKMYK